MTPGAVGMVRVDTKGTALADCGSANTLRVEPINAAVSANAIVIEILRARRKLPNIKHPY